MNNDKSKQLYRIEDAKQRDRIRELEEIENPTNRKSEIAAARQMLEAAINAGNQSVAVSILNTIDRLSKNQFRQDLVEHQLITKPAIKRFTEKMVNIFAEEISVHPGWEDTLCRVADRVDEAMAELRNEERDVQGLALPR